MKTSCLNDSQKSFRGGSFFTCVDFFLKIDLKNYFLNVSELFDNSKQGTYINKVKHKRGMNVFIYLFGMHILVN